MRHILSLSEEFKDPETDEIINPSTMELKKTSAPVGRYGGAVYESFEGHYRSWASRGSEPYYVTADKVSGSGTPGEYSPARFSREFYTKEDMLYWLRDLGIEEYTDETGKVIDPTTIELPKKEVTIDGRGYSEVAIGLRGGLYTVVGTALDGKKRTVFSAESYADVKEELAKHGYDAEKAKMSPSLRKREKERVEWMTASDKQYIEHDGVKYGDLKIEHDPETYMARRWTIKGSDEGGSVKTWRFATRAEAMEFLKEQGVAKVREGKEKIDPSTVEIPKTVATIGGTKFQEVGIAKGIGGSLYFYGVDLDGDKIHFASKGYRESYDHFLNTFLKTQGIPESTLTIGEEAQKAIEEQKKADEIREQKRKEFDTRAVDWGGYKYLDPHLKIDDDGDYRIYGYDRDGDEVSISSFGDLYDMDKYARHYGYDLKDLIDDPEIQKKYDKYKEAIAAFEEKAVTMGDGHRYADVKLVYDGGVYALKGFDARGRERVIGRYVAYSDAEDYIKNSHVPMDVVTIDDSATKQVERVKKAKELVATGEWFKVGTHDDSVYRDIDIVDNGGSWSIRGKSMDGEDKEIGEVPSWDDAIETLDQYGVTDFKMHVGGKEYGMPKDGMSRVVMMRKPGGGYSVMASKGGKSSVVYESDNEADARKWLEENNIPSKGIKTRGMNPNDDAPRTHNTKALENYDTYRMKAIEGSFVDDMTDEEKQATVDMLTEIFSKGEYRSARGLTHFGHIIDEGYKSQIETGTGGTGAAITRSGRIECSKKMFGHNGKMADSDYEKMGYLAPADDAEDYDDGDHPFYGQMTLTFKKDNLKDRSTYTFGDSLNTRYYMHAAGYAGDKPTIEGMTSLPNIDRMRSVLGYWKKYKDGDIDFEEMYKNVRRYANNNYVEMQFTGPVTADDISKATWQNKKDLYKSFDKMGDERRKRVIGILKDKGIQILYRTPDGFVDAWDALREKYPADIPA